MHPLLINCAVTTHGKLYPLIFERELWQYMAGFPQYDRLVAAGQFGQNDQKLHENYKMNNGTPPPQTHAHTHTHTHLTRGKPCIENHTQYLAKQ